MMKLLSTCCLFLAIGIAQAQTLPSFQLMHFSLLKNGQGNWSVNTPRYLSAFNPNGYNNQPCFFSNSEVYICTQSPRDSSTDILALNLDKRSLTPVTATRRLQEFSPLLAPGGQRFSAVRVETDGAQRLWSFPLDRSNAGAPVFPNFTDVGYHCWLSDTIAALFLVGSPNTLVLANVKTQKKQLIATDIGRCLLRTPTGRLAYVQKATEKTWFLKTYDLQKKNNEIVATMLPGVEDFTILPDGSFLAAAGAKLYQLLPSLSPNWKEIADLSIFGIHSISRLAVGPNNQLILVYQ